MPVTVIPASHQPKRHPGLDPVRNLDEFLSSACPDSYVPDKTEIAASSFPTPGPAASHIHPSPSSFVRSAIEAWGHHSHLALRPDEVWFTVLAQMNAYMDRHADSLWHVFAARNGGEKQEIHVDGMSWHGVVDGFRAALQARMTAPWVADWVSPGFSTSTPADEQTATVLMMGLMKNYFDYSGGITCGIPSVTLLGERADWERLLGKLGRLADFGEEPADYAGRLRPLLARMVGTFDDPAGEGTRGFWDRIVRASYKRESICGVPDVNYVVSGWILGFFYWDEGGRTSRNLSEGLDRYRIGGLEYDGISYGSVPLEELPIGYAKAKFLMTDQHPPVAGWVLAGCIGKSIVHGEPEGYRAALAGLNPSIKEEKGNDGTDGTEKKDTGFLAGILGGLNCFGKTTQAQGMTEEPARAAVSVDEKRVAMEDSRTEAAEHDHSTIQPMSGWFLFSPDTDMGPFGNAYEVELSGPTIDALKTCVKITKPR